jgi:hypothetical protein
MEILFQAMGVRAPRRGGSPHSGSNTRKIGLPRSGLSHDNRNFVIVVELDCVFA